MAPQPKPLWKRVIESKEAQKFFAKNPELAPNHSIPQPVAYHEERSERQKYHVEIIQFVMEDLPDVHRRVAEMYLLISPADIARELGVTRKEAYYAIRKMKRFAFSLWQKKRDKLRGARKDRIDLDTTPETVALRVVAFSHRDREERAYLVARDNEVQWVDVTGRPYLDDIQDILTSLDSMQDGFEVLDVEKI